MARSVRVSPQSPHQPTQERHQSSGTPRSAHAYFYSLRYKCAVLIFQFLQKIRVALNRRAFNRGLTVLALIEEGLHSLIVYSVNSADEHYLKVFS